MPFHVFHAAPTRGVIDSPEAEDAGRHRLHILYPTTMPGGFDNARFIFIIYSNPPGKTPITSGSGVFATFRFQGF